jgi:hypothetical protein
MQVTKNMFSYCYPKIFMFDDFSFSTSRNKSEAKKLLAFAMKESSRIFELPTFGRFLDENNTELAILPTMPPTYTSRGKTIDYDFYKNVFVKTPELKSILNCKEIKTLVKDIQDYQDKYEISEEDEEQEIKGEGYSDEENEFIPVVFRKEPKKKQQYSDPCRYKFCCFKGKDCKYDHSKKEKEYFKEQPNVGARLQYKTVQCAHFEKCKHMKKSYL